MLVAEPLAGPADTAHHLVDVEQNAVAPADLLHLLPIARRWGDDAAARGDGFEADRADRVRTLTQDDLLDRLRGALAVVALRAVLASILEAMRDLHEPRRKRAIMRAALWLPTGREGGERGAVVVA